MTRNLAKPRLEHINSGHSNTVSVNQWPIALMYELCTDDIANAASAIKVRLSLNSLQPVGENYAELWAQLANSCHSKR